MQSGPDRQRNFSGVAEYVFSPKSVVPICPQFAQRSLGEIWQTENDDDSVGRHIALSICTEEEFRCQSLHRSQIS